MGVSVDILDAPTHLRGYQYNTDLHLTLKWGLLDEYRDDILNVLSRLHLQKQKIFRGPYKWHGGKLLVLRPVSYASELVANAELSRLPHMDTYEFEPHITLGPSTPSIDTSIGTFSVRYKEIFYKYNGTYTTRSV